MELFTLFFPDGSQLTGCSWTLLGVWIKRFADSGVHSQQINSLLFTPRSISENEIEVVRELPTDHLQFVGVGALVMRGSERVAVATTKTMAKRIARALNNHTPNREGV